MSHELTLKPIKNDSSRRDHLVSLMLRDESGQDLAEYALLVGLIALVVIMAVTILGDSLSSLFLRLAVGIDMITPNPVIPPWWQPILCRWFPAWCPSP